MVLGLVPDCDLAHVRAAGNAAGTGALIALLRGAARREIEGVVRRVEKIETAVEPRFQEHFVEAMAIPHRTAPNPNLDAVVQLPRPAVDAPTAAASATGADARRRRRRRSAQRQRRGPMTETAPTRRPAAARAGGPPASTRRSSGCRF